MLLTYSAWVVFRCFYCETESQYRLLPSSCRLLFEFYIESIERYLLTTILLMSRLAVSRCYLWQPT